jgi:hypothetical protein
MIIEFFLTMVFGLISELLQLLPVLSLPEGAISAFGSVFSLIGTVGYFIPLGTLSSVILVMLFVYNIQIIWGAINWSIRKIPGIS